MKLNYLTLLGWKPMICRDCGEYFETPAKDDYGEEWRGTPPERFEVSPCCGSGFWKTELEMKNELSPED